MKSSLSPFPRPVLFVASHTFDLQIVNGWVDVLESVLTLLNIPLKLLSTIFPSQNELLQRRY